MQKIRYTTFLLLLTFCIIPVLSILMIHHLTLTEILSKIGSGSLGDSSVVFKISDYENIEDIISSIEHQKDTAIYMDIPGENGTIRNIFFNGAYPNLPMVKGRFFKTSDFTKKNYVCVIGKKRLNESYEKDNDKYISVNGFEYKIIGIMGYEKPTVLDNYIFINLLTNTNTDSGLFTYDFIKSDDSQNAAEIIASDLGKKNISAELMSETADFSEHIMPKLLSARWFILVLVACFICLCLISGQWIEQQKRELCIRRLVGASKKNIAILVLCKYTLIFFIAFVIGTIYCNIIFPSYFSSMLGGFIICIIIMISFILWSVNSIFRIPIEEAIK